MTDTDQFALLDHLDLIITAALADLSRQRNEIRYQRSLIEMRLNPPQTAPAAERIPLDAAMRETQETRHA